MSHRNIAALEAVRNIIKRTPQRHDQDSWAQIPADQVELEDGGRVLVSCNSTACVAGWAATIAGGKFVIDDTTDCESGVYYPYYLVDASGKTHSVQDFAKEVLGLNALEACLLFDSGQERDDVLDMLKRLIKGKSIT